MRKDREKRSPPSLFFSSVDERREDTERVQDLNGQRDCEVGKMVCTHQGSFLCVYALFIKKMCTTTYGLLRSRPCLWSVLYIDHEFGSVLLVL